MGHWISKYGIEEKWSYGATSTMPTLSLTVHWNGIAYDAPYILGGIVEADLKLKDVDGDGVPDFIFGNGSEEIITLFLPGSDDYPPQFKLIRDDSRQYGYALDKWKNAKRVQTGAK